MESTPLEGCIEYFLKFLFSNFRSHMKDSKWSRKYIFMNYTCCKGCPQIIPFQFANGKFPHSRCRAFWANLKVNNWKFFHVSGCKRISGTKTTTEQNSWNKSNPGKSWRWHHWHEKVGMISEREFLENKKVIRFLTGSFNRYIKAIDPFPIIIFKKWIF